MLPIALIVDRDADTRSMYADYLRLESWDSEEAADGRDAFVKALTRRHDVIVTETRLQFVSGYDLCRLLKHHRTTAGIPIVVVTCDVFDSDLDRAHRAGADVVLTKPCLPDRLVLALNRQVARDTTLLTPPRGLSKTRVPGGVPLSCPSCVRTLVYLEGVNAPGADYYVCPWGCGTFKYPRQAH
jgi:DNA-binding response OmpR family regulator